MGRRLIRGNLEPTVAEEKLEDTNYCYCIIILINYKKDQDFRF